MGACHAKHEQTQYDNLCSPFLENSSRISKNLEELGLHYEDSYRFSPREAEVDQERIDKKWFLKFRVGINLFNLIPERGIQYLIHNGYLAETPTIVAYFLLNCIGLSRYKIGAYVGNEEDHFSLLVLRQMTMQMSLSNMSIDQALALYQKHFHISGDNKKVQMMLSIFSEKYLESNPEFRGYFTRPSEAVLRISCSLLLLNGQLHRDKSVMDFGDFCALMDQSSQLNIQKAMLRDMYNRLKKDPFKPGWDYVTEIYHFPIYNRKKRRVRLHDYHRRLIFDCVMYRKRYGIDQPLVLLLKVTEVHVLVFNDLLTVLRKTSDDTYLLLKLINFTEVKVETKQKRNSYISIRFRKKSSDAICLKLSTSVKGKVDDLLFVIEECQSEVEETEKVLTAICKSRNKNTGCCK